MDFLDSRLWRKYRLQEAVAYMEDGIGRVLRSYYPRTEVLSKQAVYQLVKNTLMAEQEDTIERLLSQVSRLQQEIQYVSELHENQLKRMRDFYEQTRHDFCSFEKQSQVDFNFQNSSELQTRGKTYEINSRDSGCQWSPAKMSAFQHEANKVQTTESQVYGHEENGGQTQSMASSNIFGKIRHLSSNRLAIEFYGNKIVNTQRPDSPNKNAEKPKDSQDTTRFDKLDSSLRQTLNDLKASLRCKYMTGRVRPTERVGTSEHAGLSNSFDRIPLSMTGNVTPTSHSRVVQHVTDKYAYTSGHLVRTFKPPRATECSTTSRRMPPLEKPLRSPSVKPMTLR